MTKILLTGSEGRIAERIIKPALERKYEIVGFDLVLGDDILDEESIARKIDGIDYVIHTAAVPGPMGSSDRDVYRMVNYEGSKNLIKAASKYQVKKFIFFSSFARYGVDSWMRHRYEEGPITGNDVAVPKYLPIDENHPSILEYSDLVEWGGKWYGESKARVEEYGAEFADDRFAFISLRLTGVRNKSAKWVRTRKILLDESSHGIALRRKQFIYGSAGFTSEKLLVNTLYAVLESEIKGYEAFNVSDATNGNEDIVRAYFPENSVTDRIFGMQKILVLLNKCGFTYAPPLDPPAEKRSLIGRAKMALRSAVSP